MNNEDSRSGAEGVDPDPSPAHRQARGFLPGLMRRGPVILLLWLAISAPVDYAIHSHSPPPFKVSVVIRVEPVAPELIGSSSRPALAADSSFDLYIQTQLHFIRSGRVLNRVLNDPSVARSDFVKRSERTRVDPKLELQRLLEVEHLPRSYLIRVKLALPDPKEAADIANAVVDASVEESTRLRRGGDGTLKANLGDHVDEIRDKLESGIAEMREFVRPGKFGCCLEGLTPASNAPVGESRDLPVFKDVTVEQYRKLSDQLLRTDIELIEKQSSLRSKLDEAQRKPGAAERERELLERIMDEFKRDPDIASLIQQIEVISAELERGKSIALSERDPARQAAEKRRETLTKKYDALWASRSDGIRRHLEPDVTKALENQIDILKTSRESLTQHLNQLKLQNKEHDPDIVKAALLNMEMERLRDLYEVIHKKLEQRKLETEKDLARIEVVNRATPPKFPPGDRRLRSMLLAPLVILCGLAGLFLGLELAAHGGRLRAIRARHRDAKGAKREAWQKELP